MAKGFFITVEGIEGAGKSTIMQCVEAYLAAQSHEVVMTREPGGTLIAEEIRSVLLHAKNEPITPLTELLLMFAARAQHLENKILPALNAGKWVVSDRFIDASYAYQGGGRQMPENWIKTLDTLVVATHQPDLTLLLDLPVSEGLQRAASRGAPKDRIEQETVSFFERVREAYLKRAALDPARIKIIRADLPIAEVKQQVEAILKAST